MDFVFLSKSPFVLLLDICPSTLSLYVRLPCLTIACNYFWVVLILSVLIAAEKSSFLFIYSSFNLPRHPRFIHRKRFYFFTGYGSLHTVINITDDFVRDAVQILVILEKQRPDRAIKEPS